MGVGVQHPRHIQHEAGCGQKPVSCHLNEDMHLKIIFHYVIFLQDPLYTCEVQSVRNHGGEDIVVKFSFLQLTWPSGWSAIITTICIIAFLIDRYNDLLLPLLRQFLLIPNRNNKFMDLIANCSAPCLNHFCWDLISTW